MNHRAEAARVLHRVRAGGAWANVLLDALGNEPGAAAVRADVNGVLRRPGELAAALAPALDRPPERLQAEVRHVLEVGAFELLHTDTPPPVVVSACVDAVRELGAPRAAGLVNAVLRVVARSAPPEIDPVTAAGIPSWLVDDLTGAWGPEEAAAFVEASNRPPRTGIRVAPGTPPPPGAEPVAGIPGALLVDAAPPGATVQDPASVAVVDALDVPVGSRVVDLAAAPGGKTRHLLDLVGDEGVVVAVDRHPRRARTGRARAPRAHWVVADGGRPPLSDGAFDRVLLDAPCSGLGTLRRRPEIRERIAEADVARLSALQARLLDAALELLAPGGRLVYSVCTVTPAETVAVVAERGFRPPPGSGGRVWGDGRLLAPHLGPTDGMFIAVHDA